MFRLLIILLSVCCTVLCGFVAQVTENVIETDQQVPTNVVESISCQQLLDERPVKPTGLQLTGFRPGKYLGTRDWDHDENWEYLAVPFFPQHVDKLDKNYTAVIVCFDEIKNWEQLEQVVEHQAIESHYARSQQDLPTDIHSQLAQKYTSMDFRNCVVLQTGGLIPQQVALGTSVITVSLLIGGLSALVGGWNFLALLLGFFKRPRQSAIETAPVVNRAGLPSDADPPASGSSHEGMSLLKHLDEMGV